MTYYGMKKRTYDILEDRTGDKSGRFFMVFILTLIVLNVFAVILETVESFSNQYNAIFVSFEIFSVAIFSIEYILRVWSCTTDEKYKGGIKGRIKFALTPMALIDLFAVLPFYLPFIVRLDLRFLRALRLLRFFRLLKIGRYSEAMGVFGRAIKAKKEELILSVAVISILLILASSAMYYVENQAQPENFSSIPEAMWWGIATLTTVGYGDIYPITALGKILGGVIALLGIAMFALPTGILSSAFTEEIHKKKAKKPACPHCGGELSQ